jgi:hypothetical protein
MLKLAPVAAIWVIVRFSFPEFFKVSVSVWLPPTATLPKLKLVGFAVSVSTAPVVPESAIFTGLVEPSLTSATFPPVLPLDCGLKTMLKVVLCPAARVKGKLSPLVLKPVPVTLACEMIRLEPPVFISVSD